MSACLRRLASSTLVALALAGPTTAGAGEALPPVRYESYHQVHPTGLKVVAYQFPGNRIVSVAVSYHGGLLAEPPGKEGVAEIAARLVSGAAGGGQGEGFGEVRSPSIGQRMLAEVAEAATEVETRDLVFTARTVPGRLDAVLALEAERLRDPLAGVGQSAFEVARAQVADEVAGAADTRTSTRARWAILGQLVPDSLPHPRPTTPGSIQAITWDDVQAYVRSTIRPERAIVAVVGPLPARAAGAAVERAFGSAPGAKAREEQAAGPSPPGVAAGMSMPEPRALFSVRGPTRSPRLWVGWLLPRGASHEDRTAEVASTLAAMHLYFAAAGLGTPGLISLDDLGPMVLVAASIDLKQEADAGAFLAAFAKVSAVRWRPALVEMAMEFAAVRLYDQLESLGATDVARLVRLHGALDPLEEARSRLVEPLTMESWNRARSWVRREAALAVLEIPEAPDAPAPAGGAGGKAVVGAEEAGSIPSWMTRLPPGRYDVYAVAQPPGLSAAWRETLPSGLEVIGYPRPGFPRIAARLVIRRHGDAPVGLATLALGARVAPPGPAPACPRVEPQVDERALVWSRSGLRGGLDRILDALACNVVVPRFDRSLFARRRDEEVKGLEATEKALGKEARRAEIAAAIAFDPGRKAALPATADSIDDLSRGDAEDWVEAQLRPDRATLILAGDLPTQEDVMVSVDARFRNWARPGGGPPRPDRAAPAAPARRSIHVGDTAGKEWATVRIRVRWRPGSSPDVPAEVVVARELDRRLRREQRHGLREISVYRHSNPSDPALEVQFRARPERAGEATHAALDVIGLVAQAPALAENVAFQRWMIAARFPLSFTSVTETADRIVEQVREGRPPDWWDRYPASISGLGTERVEAASSRLAAGREVVLVLGDRAKVLPSLAKEGLAVEKPGS